MPPGSSTIAWRQSVRAHQAADFGRCERDPRQDRHAVVALHPVHQHMAIAERLEQLAREQLVGRLGLLQAQDVRRPFRDEPPDIVDAQPDRVDVPGDKAQGLIAAFDRDCAATEAGLRHGTEGAKTTAPGRGGRPGACMSEAFGGNRARRGDGPF